MRPFDLRVIRLEPPVDRLHGVVHGDLNQGGVDRARRARTPRGDRALCDFIPIGDCVGVDGSRPVQKPMRAC
jgi:hypothetical protein